MLIQWHQTGDFPGSFSFHSMKRSFHFYIKGVMKFSVSSAVEFIGHWICLNLTLGFFLFVLSGKWLSSIFKPSIWTNKIYSNRDGVKMAFPFLLCLAQSATFVLFFHPSILWTVYEMMLSAKDCVRYHENYGFFPQGTHVLYIYFILGVVCLYMLCTSKF